MTDLDAQDCLFTTYLHGFRDEIFDRRDPAHQFSESDRIYPYQDFSVYLELARQEPIRFIFSNTTESGIVFSADDKLNDKPPASFPGKLARLLHERYTCILRPLPKEAVSSSPPN